MKDTRRMFVMRAKLENDGTTLMSKKRKKMMSRKRKDMMMSMRRRNTIPINNLAACFTLPHYDSRSRPVSMSCHSVYLR